MTELYRQSSTGIETVEEVSFANESGDFEDLVTANPSLLGEGVQIVGRQVSTPVGRLDLLALIQMPPGGGQIAVVELKNSPADTQVLLQALRYASWTLENPDSIRLQLTNAHVSMKDVDLSPKIIVAAPVITSELVELSQYVEAFEFDFVEIRRFKRSKEFFFVVTHKFPKASIPAQATPREEWSWERYQAELAWKEDRVAFGRRLLSRVESKVSGEAWPLSCRFRRFWIVFQLASAKNVVGIQPKNLKEWWLWFRLPRSPKKLRLQEISLDSVWDEARRTLSITIQSPEVDLGPLDPYFDAAYKWASGEIS